MVFLRRVAMIVRVQQLLSTYLPPPPYAKLTTLPPLNGLGGNTRFTLPAVSI